MLTQLVNAQPKGTIVEPSIESEVSTIGYHGWQPRQNDCNYKGYIVQSSNKQNNAPYRPPHFFQHNQYKRKSEMSELADQVKNQTDLVKEHDDDMGEINMILSQLPSDMSEIKNSQGRLHSHHLPTPKGTVNALTLLAPKKGCGGHKSNCPSENCKSNYNGFRYIGRSCR